MKLRTHEEVGRGLEELKKFETFQLVRELEKRAGVEIKTAEPYEELEINVEGPAILLVIKD